MGAGDSPEYKSSKEKAEKLQQKLKELKEEKEGINAQISNKKDIKEEDKKEEDKKEEGKKEDKKEEDKKEENTPTIGLKKISFSLLDSEGKYNPKYTAEYTNGIQQEAKPTKHKTKREEKLKTEKMQQRIGEIDEQIKEIKNQLASQNVVMWDLIRRWAPEIVQNIKAQRKKQKNYNKN